MEQNRRTTASIDPPDSSNGAFHPMSLAGDILARILALEQEIAAAFEEKQRRFGYQIVKGKARFEEQTKRRHAELRVRLLTYLRNSRLPVVLTAPIIYSCLIPFVLLDLFLSVYQLICFPIYGIPLVRRRDYLIFDRGRLKYLNLLERLNCVYCSYANGLCGYVTEIAARTEQHWCPIKHAERLRSPHSRYSKFFEYGDAEHYRRRLEEIRAGYNDLVSSPGDHRSETRT